MGNVWRFCAGYEADLRDYIKMDYDGENIGYLRKPDRETGKGYWLRGTSRIFYKRRGMVDFHEDAYLASAFAKNKKMEAFINKLYDNYEEYFAICLELTPYKYHRIFLNMDAATKMRAIKALAIINAVSYDYCLKEFMLHQVKKFYKKIYESYYKKSLSGKEINIYKELAAEYDLASLSVQELGELYAIRIYIIKCSTWSYTAGSMHGVFDDANEIICLCLATEDMAMLKPYGVRYLNKEAHEAKDGYLRKWGWCSRDDIGVPVWEEAWIMDENKMFIKTTVSNRKRQIEYVARSKNREK